jgi:hypothetical protein
VDREIGRAAKVVKKPHQKYRFCKRFLSEQGFKPSPTGGKHLPKISIRVDF